MLKMAHHGTGPISVGIAFLGAILMAAPAASQESLPSDNWLRPPAIADAPRVRIAYLTGNTFLSQCRNSRVTCEIYVQGVNDGLFAAMIGTNRDLPYCIPEGSTISQVTDVVLNFMERYPEDRHLLAPTIIANALQMAWPQCGTP